MVVFALVMFVVCYILIKRLAENDTFIEVTKSVREQQQDEAGRTLEDKMR